MPEKGSLFGFGFAFLALLCMQTHRMKRYQFLFALLASLAMCSCRVLNKIPKTQFANGYYILETQPQNAPVYADVTDTSLRLYPVAKINGTLLSDTTASSQPAGNGTVHLRRETFDIDLLTIPLKFRLPEAGVPLQLNANLNGAAYLGYRTDHYVVSYATDPLGRTNRNVNHFGFSGGLFTGIGNTDMTPTNTANRIGDEYDAVVWSKGIAGIIGVNNVTVGITIGWDYLLDKNRPVWIYQSKPWFGLAFGLNLN